MSISPAPASTTLMIPFWEATTSLSFQLVLLIISPNKHCLASKYVIELAMVAEAGIEAMSLLRNYRIGHWPRAWYIIALSLEQSNHHLISKPIILPLFCSYFQLFR